MMPGILGFMTPDRFLALSGAVLTVLGAAGIAGLLRRFSSASVFNPPPWINWVHLGVGIVFALIAFGDNAMLQRRIVLVGAIMGTLLGVLGLTLGRHLAHRFHLPALADRSDHLAHLTVGALALWAWSN
jgi:hypothetical protein